MRVVRLISRAVQRALLEPGRTAGVALLAEDLVPSDAVRGERAERGVEFLAQVQAACLADGHVRARGVLDDGVGGGGPGTPRLPQSAIGRGG